ncbi:MAG: DUF3842 family protein [Clostridia bacterium]|nr:DUF3842 family protein [Clostridia bacterium]
MVNRFSNRVLIIDGQGGNMGRQLVEQLFLQSNITLEVTVVGTNAIATANMLKASARVQGATGENAVVVAARKADVIVGPVGIVMADALLGEITPAMANAVAQSNAYKVLLPVNKCNHFIVGVRDDSMSQLVQQAVQEVIKALNWLDNRPVF